MAHDARLIPVSCCKCGVVFGMTNDFYGVMADSGESRDWYCPNGHMQHFVYTREENDPDPGEEDDEEHKVVQLRVVSENTKRK